MISFESDYICGAHPMLLQRLEETNLEPLPGYGADRYSQSAKEKIRAACNLPEADIFLISGGTQTNRIVISSLLKPFEGVIAGETGHISVHEAGAIEASGHKVLPLPVHEGKICASDIQHLLKTFYADGNHEHMVFPGMVYISFPTELGTLYNKQELSDIHQLCRAYQIPLFVDGARLGYGLMSPSCDITLPELARLCDVFYIGGTKVGALLGEAVVFSGQRAPAHFLTMVKQQGALLAKGRTMGVQFDTLFTDGLYFELSRHAIEMAQKLKAVLQKAGYRFYLESPTNQQFIILENPTLTELQKAVAVSFWEQYDEDHTVIRLATSWSTTDQDIEALRSILKTL